MDFDEPDAWLGARVSDVLRHPNLDMKPRRLVPKALQNMLRIQAGTHVRLGDIADVVGETFDVLTGPNGPATHYRLIEGQNIRAEEGTVLPQFPARAWQIAERKSRHVYRPAPHDIIVGLVRPERRNVGMYLIVDDGLEGETVAAPDGVAIVRIKDVWREQFPQGWLFTALRSEHCRIQLWTESGGTSYGKLTHDHILNILVRVPPEAERAETASAVEQWAESIETGLNTWQKIGTPEDRRPILNSAIHGLAGDVEDE
jgi:type I restriction enzyme M protein